MKHLSRRASALFLAYVCLAPLTEAVGEGTPSATPTYRCRYTTSKIAIDGKLEEPAWKSAETMADWTYPWYATGPKQGAKAWLLWDKDALYMAAHVDDTELVGSVAVAEESRVWHDERFEFYVDSNPKDALYRCWEFTTMKHKLDYAASWGRKFYFQWDAEGLEYAIRIKGTLNDDKPDRGYTIEARVPFRPNFEKGFEHTPEGQETIKPKFVRSANVPPKPGDVWYLGVNREDQYLEKGKKKYVLSMWCDPKVAKPDFHVPSAFGRMAFLPER